MPISFKAEANRMSAELPPSMKTRLTSMPEINAGMSSASLWGNTTPAASSGPNVIVVFVQGGSSVEGYISMYCTLLA